MALQPGKKDNQASVLSAVAGFIGFTALAGVALAILAGVVLLPAYARLKAVQYERDCRLLENADAQYLINARENLLQSAKEDPTIMIRLAKSHLDLQPKNEVLVRDPSKPAPPLVVPIKTPPPPRPDNWMLRAAAKLQDDKMRRGLLLMAGGALLAAMFLFPPPSRYSDN